MPASEDKPISEFPIASPLTNRALALLSAPNGQGGYDSVHAELNEIGRTILETEYTQDLNTTDKTIFGAINENKSVIGYSYDEYDATTAYSTGDLCIYNNVLYKAKQATTGNLPTNTTYWESTSIADAINELKLGQSITLQESSNPIPVNGSFQLSNDVLSHKLILIEAIRQGLGGSILLNRDDLYRMDNGFPISVNSQWTWVFNCTNSGLITLLGKSSDLNEPYIRITAFL